MLTIFLPAASQLPLFVGTSWVLSHASVVPTVLDSEAFLTLTSLAHADATATLPILLGIITLANVESSRWFASAEALQRERRVAKWTAERRARGEQILEPSKISQSALRLLSVGRILIAAMVPGVSPCFPVIACRARCARDRWTVAADSMCAPVLLCSECAAVLGDVGDIRVVPVLGVGLLGYAAA